MDKVRTRYGNEVEILGSTPGNEYWIECRCSDGIEREFHISDLRVGGGAEVLNRIIVEANERRCP